ncbi:MAG: DUF1801 domain-containing protein [Candidatus Dojkabacteria bacterium]
MAELKTKVNDASVEKFIESVQDESQKKDSEVIDKLMQEISGDKPKMWGPSIVGYGLEHLHYASGRDLEWLKIGFSPRKTALTLYVLKSEPEKFQDLLNKLGKHKIGKGCLYIKKLSDVNMDVLKALIERALNTEHSTNFKSE